ncbi:MAG: cytochrome oxidase [Massilia sp.]|nr:cytochrome oxidase [Massilia sp.]
MMPGTYDAERNPVLDRTWSDPPGIIGWFSVINHKTVAIRFMLTTFGFFVAGGVLALLIRLQLARPDSKLVGPDFYNQLFTMHGTTMMFLFAVPVMQAVATYLVPLMIGARGIAFPRMNAFAYWIFLMGGLMLYVAFILDIGPDAGWFSYPPLAGPEYSPGKRVDFWAQLITFTELSGLLEAVILITTIFKMRAPGMSLNRVPLYVWTMLVTSFMVMFAMPSVMLASTALITDRLVGTHFYNPAEGGDVVLWQHLFWFFGHPEVYMIFIPPLGFMSSIIATFSRRPIYGYPVMVLAIIATAFLAFSLWVHHMFTTNVPELGKSFFTAASAMIAIPTAAQMFCWIATLGTGKLNFKTPMLFVLSFFVILLIGGLSGIMLASVSLDLQVHDSFFVVAHLHYVLLGGAVFPLFGAFYYWFPKFTGRMMNETLGRWNFWLMFAGFNIAFFPMHIAGLQGMPRRVYTYPTEMGWGMLNLISTLGAAVLTVGILLFIVNVLRSRRGGAIAGADPWQAGTLEWSTDSPPAPGNFSTPPVVASRYPLWSEDGIAGSVTGLADHRREVLVTSVLDAVPDHRATLPEPSIWPFISALAVTVLFVASIFTPWAVVWGAVLVTAPLVAWFWPRRGPTERNRRREVKP